MADSDEKKPKKLSTEMETLSKKKKEKETDGKEKKKKKDKKKKDGDEKKSEEAAPRIWYDDKPDSELTSEQIKDRDIVRRFVAWKKEGKTNQVLVGVFVNALKDYNAAEENIYVEIGVYAWWFDPELVGKEGEDFEQEKIWKPSFEFTGDIDLEETIENGGSFYIREEYAAHGVMSWYQKWKGHIYSPQVLHDFPFDKQVVKIKLGSKYYADEVCHCVDYTSSEQIDYFSAAIKMEEWDLVKPAEIREVVDFLVEDSREVSYLEIDFHMRRRSGFYLKNIVSVIFVLCIMSWCMYAITAETLNDRLQVSITLFLAQVAFNFVVAESLPRVSYSTYLSQYFLVSYVFIGLGAVESVVAFFVNKYACGVMPGQASCETANKLDWFTAGVVAFLTVSYTLFFVFLGFRKHKGEYIIAKKEVSRNISSVSHGLAEAFLKLKDD